MRPHVLLVEDRDGDARLIREAMQDAGSSAELHVVATGPDAMDFLHKQGAWVDAARPDLILLDLNLEHGDGREVLAGIKGSLQLRAIPTIVLTNSTRDADTELAYGLGASCFLVKPYRFEELRGMMVHLVDLWLPVRR